jgi:toxin ParE1/3/4
VKPVIFHKDAEDELRAAVDYYERQRGGLGLDLQSEVENAVRTIQQNPQLWPQYKATDYRKCNLQRFPFTIFYLELVDHIWIAAVAHQKRKPGYWRGRTPE